MWLVIESGPGAGRSARIEGKQFTIGRAANCGLRVEHPDVAPHHATITTGRDSHLELRDEGSAEGTFLEGERVTAPVPLNGDEKVRLGNDVLLSLTLEQPTGALRGEPFGSPLEGTVEVPVRRWRAVARSLRETRRAVQRALVAAAAALAIALALGVLLLTGVIGGDRAERASVADVVDRAAPSTVLVRTRLGHREATGSGFALDTAEGLVVTNFHVINGGKTFDVRVGDDFREARLVGAAPCDDLALLEVDDAEDMRDISFGAQTDLKQGQEVVALGFPANPSLRGELTSTAGVVSVPRSAFQLPTPDSPHFENLIQTDAALNPGNSGGPLVDSESRLVGVNTAIYAARRGPASAQGYAIGVDRVKEVVDELRQGRSQRWLGAGMTPPPQRVIRRAGRSGLLVTSAVPGTAAAAAGFEGVLLTAFNGSPLDGTIAGYCTAAEGVESGDMVEVEAVVVPGGAPQVLTIEMG
jgi:S1-C subfamily serine protease